MFTLKKYLANDSLEVQKESAKKIEDYIDLVRNFTLYLQTRLLNICAFAHI